MVHQYGGEPLHNIFIDDLPDGLELLEYRYDVPMYLYRLAPTEDDQSTLYQNATLDGTIKCEIEQNGETKIVALSELSYDYFEKLVDPLTGSDKPKVVKIEDNNYILAKIEYGQTAGYRETPLTYAGDLIANVGESITSVLDKIKNMLGEFEYFYDLDGHFIFQQKQSFVNTLYSPLKEAQDGENKKKE
jgi:hypothetical protein